VTKQTASRLQEPEGTVVASARLHRTGDDIREEGSTMSGLSTDVLRAIEIERLRRAKQSRLARGIGR
jgi:hypothetical protein